MHPKIAERRNDVLACQTLASDHLIVANIDRVENLLLSANKALATAGHFAEMLEFCRISKSAILNSSPFTGEGRTVREVISRGFAELGIVMSETAKGVRDLQEPK